MILSNNKEKGFSILAVILVIVAVIVAIGVWALSGQTNTSNSGNSGNDIQAASIINDSGAIKLAFDTLVINGSNPATIMFRPNVASTLTAPNMLDPVNGIQVPKVNVNAIKAGSAVPEGMWVYNPVGFYASAGTVGGADLTILISGIKKGVCERINNTLYANTTIPVTTLANSAKATELATAASPMSIATINLTTITTGWTSGCVTTVAGADDNVFFRVLKAN